MAHTPKRLKKRRGQIIKLAAGVLAYWLLLLVFSLPGLRLPAILEPILIAGGLPLIIAGAVMLWRQSRSSMSDLAFKDDLTGLANRRAFRERALQMLDRAAAGSIAAVLLDVDGLKTINDECGHQAGDELLLRLGEQLTRLAPDPSCVYRIGGDEFAILIDRSTGSGIANVVGQLQPITGLFSACKHHHEIDVSFGFASNLLDEGIDPLFKRADERLREYKRRQYDSGELPDRRAAALQRGFEEDASLPKIASIQERRLSRNARSGL